MSRLINRFELMEEAGAEAAGGGSPPGETAPAPPADPTPPPVPDDWRSSLPTELRDSPSLQDVPDLQTLVKNYENTKAMVGNSVRIPTDEAGQEAIDAFTNKLLEHQNIPLMRKPDPDNPEAMAALYKSLGRPDEAAGYQLPEGVDAEAFGAMKETAHEVGLTRRQYETLAAKQAGIQQAVIQQMEEKRAASVAEVKGEWGPAFDEKVGRAAQVAEALNAPKELVEAMKNGTVNGATLRFLDTVAAQIGAEGSPLAQQIGRAEAETVSAIEQKITERIDRMINEDLSPAEHQRLIDANVRDKQRLIAARR